MATAQLRVLYSEDDVDQRDLISLLLAEEGIETVCSETSEDILTIAKAEKFDLYLLDTWMPGMSGVDLCKKIREFDTLTPILFYSAAGYQRDKDEATAAGAQGYIVKPADCEQVISAIRGAIAVSRVLTNPGYGPRR